jgi:hypothetical protein
MLARLAVASPDSVGFSLEQGLIKYKGNIWIGQNSTLQTKLIAAFHSSPLGGHSGVAATYYKIKKHFGRVSNRMWRASLSNVKHANMLNTLLNIL